MSSGNFLHCFTFTIFLLIFYPLKLFNYFSSYSEGLIVKPYQPSLAGSLLGFKRWYRKWVMNCISNYPSWRWLKLIERPQRTKRQQIGRRWKQSKAKKLLCKRPIGSVMVFKSILSGRFIIGDFTIKLPLYNRMRYQIVLISKHNIRIKREKLVPKK